MDKPEVKIIQSQEETTSPANIDSWEAEQLLRKYGYSNQSEIPATPAPIPNPDANLTFEEMVARQEAKKREEEAGRRASRTNPQNDYSEVKYSSDEDTGFSFRIEINSDMKLPKY